MSKSLKKGMLFGQPALLAISLAAVLGTVSCTTDRSLGNGDPVTTPGVRTSPTASPTTGSESTHANPPMMSSSRFDAVPIGAVSRPVSAIEAATIMAAQAPKVRVLGPAAPGTGVSLSGQQVTGQFVNPALSTNPQLTINSSISSSPTEAITSGAGGPVSGGTTASFTVTNGVSSNALLQPTGAAPSLGAGPLASAGTASVTGVSAANTGAGVATPGATVTGVRGSNTRGGTIFANTATATSSATATGGVRLVNSNGRVVITNTTSSNQ